MSVSAPLALAVDARLLYRFDSPAEVVLLLEAANGPDQTVEHERLSLTPATAVSSSVDPVAGERRAIFTASGEVHIAYHARVSVARPPTRLAGLPPTRIADLPPDVVRFLRPSRFCPSDVIQGFAERRFGALTGGDRAEAIAVWVAANLDYDGSETSARTTALDTFASRKGVCRDFAHLTVSLCRAMDIPARVVSAYAWKLDPPDMHAVAEVFVDGRWRLVDATCKAPVEGLVRVATGLDAADIAFMTVHGEATLIEQSFTVAEASPAHATMEAVA